MPGPIVGDRVLASMNGRDWFAGCLVEESEIFAPYGVLCDDFKEVRYFLTIKEEL